MKKRQLITMSELSRLSGRSRQAISKACKAGGILFSAVVDKKINVNHKTVQDYLKKSRIDAANLLKKGPPKKEISSRNKSKKAAKKTPPSRNKSKKAAKKTPPSDEKNLEELTAGFNIPLSFLNELDIENFEEMTIKDVALRFGGVPGFKNYVDVLKVITEYKTKALTVKQKRNELVDRVMIQSVSIALIDLAFKRLVTDIPSSLSQEVSQTLKAGSKNILFKIEELYKKSTSKILKDVKKEVLKNLKKVN